MECRARYAEAFSCAKLSHLLSSLPDAERWRGQVPAILTDPDIPAEELRQRLYPGTW